MRTSIALLPLGVLSLSLLFVHSDSAFCAVYGFLEQAPMRYFNAEDSARMSANIEAVLADPTDNRSRSWHNDATGNRGSAEALRSFEHQEMKCRRLRVDNRAKGIEEQTTAELCQVEGVWKVLRMLD